MAIRRRRLALWAVLVAVALALLVSWWAGAWRASTPESRARETAEGIRDRIRELTH